MSVLNDVIDILSKLIIPVIIFYLLWTIFNIVKDYKQYGNKIFSAFKKYERTGELKDIIINILEQENTVKPIIVSKDANTFFAFTNKEIYGVVVIDFYGKLSGKIMDEYLVINGKEKNFINPVCQFTKDLKKIKNQKINVHPFIIRASKNTEINIDGISSEKIMTIKDFSYYIYKNQNIDNKYNSDELKKSSKVVEKIINEHN